MLLDQGADVNSIYRSPRNVVMTPLDCSLNKGFRSTAKFLQLHSGLPASKLRLSGRNPNAINDQELVKPLHSVKLTKSDPKNSEDGSKNSPNCGHSRTKQNCQCNVTERCRKRHPRLKCCIHIRASSCETHVKGNESSDMNRSKSNIELRRTRKTQNTNRKSRSQRSESTNTYSSSSSSSESECVNCKRKQRDNSKKSRRSRAKSTPRRNTANCNAKQSSEMQVKENQSSSDEEWNRKSVTKTHYKKSSTKTTTKVFQNKQKIYTENNQSHPDECIEPEIPIQENSLVESNNLDNENEKVEGAIENPLTIDESHSNMEKDQQPIASIGSPLPDVSQTENAPQNPNIIIAIADIHDSPISQVESKNDDQNHLEGNKEEVVETSKLLSESNSIVDLSKEEHPEKDQKDCYEPSNDKTEEVNHNTNGLDETANLKDQENTFASGILKNTDEISDTVPNNDSNAEKPTVNTTEETTNLQPNNNQEVQIDLPLTEDIVNVQEIVNSLPLQSAPEENPKPVRDDSVNRKSSFTVLVSDESVDHNMLDINSDSIDEGPSFEVLDSNGPNFQMDDANKTSDDENQITVSADEDEMSSLTAGRRKRVKSRAQSTVGRRVGEQNSRDQDSGFEPSPRAVRTKIPSPQLLSGVVKSRRSVIGGKPSNVDMTAVSQSLSMNIRR